MVNLDRIKYLSAQELASLYVSSKLQTERREIRRYAESQDKNFQQRFYTFMDNPAILDIQED